jgi:NAD(P)-dependent dehydrogenase (short-subunit alcohol dehydrogenase family)
MSGFITHRNPYGQDIIPSLKDKVAVCTGGNSGIGREIVLHLLIHDISKVYVLARSEEKFQDAIIFWKQNQARDAETRVEFIQCDLGDLLLVKQVADDLIRRLDRLDILFNNAGKCLTM